MATHKATPTAPAELTAADLSNPVQRYVLATRPAFLSITLFACLIGLATARFDGVPTAYGVAIVSILVALLAHAGINVLNDYYDELGGTDRINTERIYPFTGGSRFIQNGILSARQTLRYGAALMGAVALGVLWLTTTAGAGLIGVGVAGLFIGWAYSAPPLKLNSRGLGEVCVAVGFALLAVGADFAQRGALSWLVWNAALPFALLVTNVLYINQFPDYRADKAAGKDHWVVRLGPERARWGYVLIAGLAYLWLGAAVAAGALPGLAAIALLPALLSLKAARILLRRASQPQHLTPAIKLTIAAASVQGLLMAVALFLATPAVAAAPLQ